MTTATPVQAGTTADLEHVVDRVRLQSQSLLRTSAITTVVESRVSRPYSSVARVRYSSPEASGVFYAKVFRTRSADASEHAFMAQRVARDFEVTTRLYEIMRQHDELAVVRPIACFPDLLALVTEAAPGRSLLEVIEKDARLRVRADRLAALGTALGRVGRWLAVFQSMDVAQAAVERAEVSEYIDVRLRRLVAHPAFAFNERDRNAVLARIDALWETIGPDDRWSVPVHADLALGNVLVDPSRITVIDLAMTNTGARLHDVTHLYMQLDLLSAKPIFFRSTVRSLQRSLLDGFEPGLSENSPLFRIMLLQHVACHASGLLHRPAGPLARVYNRWVARRHLAFLRSFVTPGAEGDC